jgi:NitT/TauT family transport system permease protein
VLTWSGVASVNNAYYDVARTLGAKPSFLIFKVAIPAALPHVFVGLFMGLGSSFAVLVVAEMIGRQGRPRLVPAMGAGLGGLRQHVCGADRHGTDLLGADHAALRVRDSPAGLAEGPVKW